ncbi:hypothetical protein L204_101706 [Cryptococcus depauperatus]
MMLLSPSLAPIPEDFAVVSPPDTPPLTPLNTPQDEPLFCKSSDLEIVSSNGVRLRTSSSLLRTSSTVFVSMVKPPKAGYSSTIHFTDLQLECASTLSLFLRLISSHTLPPPTQSFSEYETLIRFMKQYKCSSTLFQKLSKHLYIWLEEGCVSASKVFRAGTIIGDEKLCKKAVAAGNDWTWASVPRQPPRAGSRIPTSHASTPAFNIHEDGISGAPTLDISAMPFSFFKTLPDEYKFALMRATRSVVGSAVVLDQCDWDKVAGEFEKILCEVKQPKKRS